jgi:hypothetical protein
VVIGILIALSINNWNEQNKEDKIEHKYLERLVIDLSADSLYYVKKIAESELAIQQLNEFIHKSYETQKNIEEVKELCSHLFIDTDPLTTQNSTYKELTGSGNIIIIKNESLKKLIVDYYWVAEDLTAQINEFNLVSTQFFVESGRVLGKMIKFSPDFEDIYNDSNMFLEGEWDFFNDPKSEKFQSLEVMALVYYSRNREYLTHFNRLKSLSSNLKRKLEETLQSTITE